MKRIISKILVGAMVLTAIPLQPISAAEAKGDSGSYESAVLPEKSQEPAGGEIQLDENLDMEKAGEQKEEGKEPAGAAENQENAKIELYAESRYGEEVKNSEGFDYVVLEDGTVEVRGYTEEKKGPLVIPDTIEGKTVTSIGREAFKDCNGFTSLTLPKDLKQIEYGAFQNCIGIRGKLELPENIVSIGSFVFSGCSSISGSLELPKGLTKIEAGVFSNCSLITGTLELPEGVTVIESGAFSNCSGLTGDLVFPEGLTSIGTQAFWQCKGLNGKVMFSKGLVNIEDDVFHGCSGLNGNLELPEGLTSIGYQAFYECSGLNGNLTLPEGLISIGDRAFYGCSRLTGDIMFPKGFTSLGNWAFGRCTGFNGKLVFSEELVSIGESAFYECSGLTGDLILPDGIVSIGENAFSNCSGLDGKLTLPKGISSIGKGMFSGCSGLSGELVLPETLTHIGDNAFSGCSGLNGNLFLPEKLVGIGVEAFFGCSGFDGKLFLPESLTSVGINAFSGIYSLTELEVAESNQDYSAYDGCLYNKDMTELVACLISKEEINFPFSVTAIGNNAFSSCKNLASIKIPETVVSIGDYAFYYCENLKRAEIPDSVISIGADAFRRGILTIICNQGSEAEKYAKNNYINYTYFNNGGTCEEHQYDTGEILEEAACTSEGKIRYTCIVCGESYEEEIPALGHEYDAGTVTESATCSAEGKKEYTCINCGNIFEELIPQKAHQYGAGTVTKKATCASEGEKSYTCKNCGNVKKETIAKTAHTYETTTEKASMEEDGGIIKECSVCGVSTTTVIYAPKDVVLSQTSYFYDGKTKAPAVTVKDRMGNALRENTDYAVSYSSGRKNIGNYEVSVTFQGNYEGVETVEFEIVAQEGKTFTSGACRFKVVDESSVAVTGVKNKNTSKVRIPKTVTYGGSVLEVVSIADKAFRKTRIKEVIIGDNVESIGVSSFEDCPKLTKATLGKGVEKISKNAFKGCKKLKTVTIKSAELESVGKNAFKGIYKNAKIKVPKKKLSAYKKLLKNKGQGKKVKIVK